MNNKIEKIIEILTGKNGLIPYMELEFNSDLYFDKVTFKKAMRLIADLFWEYNSNETVPKGFLPILEFMYVVKYYEVFPLSELCAQKLVVELLLSDFENCSIKDKDIISIFDGDREYYYNFNDGDTYRFMKYIENNRIN